jgi:signal transduction histidine kinase/CheY-like chemotaxis protein
MGAFIFLKNKKSAINVTFALVCLVTTWWQLSWFFLFNTANTELVEILVRVGYAGIIFIPVTFFHFFFHFLDIKGKLDKFLLFFSYTASVVFELLLFNTNYFVDGFYQFSWGYYPKVGFGHLLYLSLLLLLLFRILFLLIFSLRHRDVSPYKYYQIKYFLWAMIFYSLAAVDFLTNYGVPFYPVGFVFIIIFLGIIAYTIIRYRLMDIRIVARYIFIYFGISIFVYIIFYFLIWLYNNLFGSVFSKSALATGIFIAPLFVFLFYRVDKFLKHLANKYLFASLYSYQETINKLTDELTYSIDLKKIINLIVDTIRKTMQLERAGVLLIEPNTNSASVPTASGLRRDKPTHYQIAKVIGFNEKNGISLVQDSALTKRLEKTKAPLVRDELLLLASDAKNKKEKDDLKRLHDNMEHIEASLCLPLMSGAKLIGLIVLGGKISGDAYTAEDLELLNTLSKQAGIAIENARLYKKVAKFNETLQGKVDEQTKDIKEKNQYLQELLNIKSDFLHIVNHQLNTPLSVMRNAFSMLEDKSIDYKKGMEYLKGGLTRMSETIKDFWDAFELEGQKMELAPKETDIGEIIKSQVEEKKRMPKAKEKGLEIKVESSDFAVPKVFCDPKKIVHVISNLLDNAVYYTAAGGVSVSYEKSGEDYLKIKVADTGAGISEQDQKNLFKKFSRGKESEAMRPDGSGLGLYIAKRIADGHGGELKLEKSEPGKGTAFSFSLPIYRGQKEIVLSKNKKRAEEIFSREKEGGDKSDNFNKDNSKSMDNKTPAASEGETPARPKILMVEDEPNLIDMYKDYLIKNGFDFYNTKNIEEALVIAKTARIDAVLLDIVIPKEMPDGSIYTMAQQGWDFLKKARQDPKIKNIPIVVWTNFDSEADKKKAKDLGADGFIFKGETEPRKLVEEIKRIIGEKNNIGKLT